MAIHTVGTFEYVAVVPDDAFGASISCAARLRQAIKLTADDRRDSRLVGHAPQLRITDAGPTPDPGPNNPATQRSRISLVASGRQNATVAEVSFLVDRGVISALRPGDSFYLSRNGAGSIGISALRGGQLVFAAGAITVVPLGDEFTAKVPFDLVQEATAVFRKRDPHFELPEYPVEVCAAGERHIMFGGARTLGDFKLWMLHGLFYWEGGRSECAAVARAGACSPVDANTSALFLDTHKISMVNW